MRNIQKIVSIVLLAVALTACSSSSKKGTKAEHQDNNVESINERGTTPSNADR